MQMMCFAMMWDSPNDVALRANGHACGVIWHETVEMFTDLLYNEIKILASINTAKGDEQ